MKSEHVQKRPWSWYPSRAKRPVGLEGEGEWVVGEGREEVGVVKSVTDFVAFLKETDQLEACIIIQVRNDGLIAVERMRNGWTLDLFWKSI